MVKRFFTIGSGIEEIRVGVVRSSGSVRWMMRMVIIVKEAVNEFG